MQTNFVATSFKATQPQKRHPYTVLGVIRHYFFLWIHYNSTRSLISALAKLLLNMAHLWTMLRFCS